MAKRETQKTPQGEEIPIPTRRDFLDNLKQAAKPKDDEAEDKDDLPAEGSPEE